MQEKVDLLIEKIKFGDPVLFTGAGFSYGMTNINGASPKGSSDLSKVLQEKMKIEYSSEISLKDIVDNYIDNEKTKDLINILEDEFTISKVCQYHQELAEINWRRCYTTNYDLGFEEACKNIQKKMRTINPLTNSELLRDGNVCIHINGDMTMLNSSNLSNGFTLGDISYLLNNFEKTYWFRLLKQDFESAPAIVFIGYSLYDDTIRKILRSNNKFKEKTFIITSPSASQSDLFKLKMYGHVLNIGTEKFSLMIKNMYKEIILPIKHEHLKNLIKFEYKEDNAEIRKDDIYNFLLFGNIESKKIHHDYKCFLKNKESHLIPRVKYIHECVEKIQKNKNILIKSEIGNGKSVFLEQLIIHLFENENVNIYIPTKIDAFSPPSYADDLEKLKKSKALSVIICDDLNQNEYLVSDYSMLQEADNIILISSVRSIEYDKIDFMGINFDTINIDELSDKFFNEKGESETDYLIELIDILNFWGDGNKVTLPKTSKKRVLLEKYNNQISETLLDLFSSENIINKIKDCFKSIIDKPETRNISFLILLFKYLNIPINNYIIKELLNSDYIDSISFTKHENISLIYSENRNSGFTKQSSIFCRVALKNLFENGYKTEAFLNLVGLIESEKKRKNSEKDSNILDLKDSLIKEIMRFSNVDNLLSDKGKKESLFRYYSDLILKATWLKSESHYWLQLAMANIANKNLAEAQSNLDTAYRWVEKKQDTRSYSTSSIDTQQARLYIMKSLGEQHDKAIWDYFIKAHNLLSKCENDKYRYRQVKEYKKFFKQYSLLSKKNKTNFRSCCEYMIQQIQNLNDSDAGEPEINSCKYMLNKILNVIE